MDFCLSCRMFFVTWGSVAGYVTEWKTKRYGARGGKTSKPNRNTNQPLILIYRTYLYIIGKQLTLVLARKTKTGKTPCAWCKMALTSHWYCDWLRIPRASSGIFSQSQHHPIGFCIKRKAINRKNLLLWQLWNVPQEEWITAFCLQQ